MSVMSRFIRFFQPRSPKIVVNQLPLFQRQIPWWAHWTWGLIACDLFMTGSAIELTYNYWTTLASDLESSAKDIKGDDAPNPDQYVLRSSWQRISVCTAHMAFGAGIAAALLIAQMRFVRTLVILPPGDKARGRGRELFFQCAHNWRTGGKTYPMNKCKLENGRNSSELILRVVGERGHWYIGLVNSYINGKPLTGAEARAQLLAAWNGKLTGPSTLRSKQELDIRWKSGPVCRS